MDFTPEQEMTRKMVREFALREIAPQIKEHDRAQTFDRSLLPKMAAQGLLGICLPVRYGGAGMDYISLGIACEELERVDTSARVILSVHVGLNSLTLFQWGTEAQKQELLPKIAAGDLIMTLALTEPSARWDADGVQLAAKAEGDSFVLNGTKLFVADAHISDYMLVAVRTKEGADPENGVTLLLVDSKSPGIEYALLKTIGSDKQCEVVFNNVRVPKANILGQADKGWPIIQSVKPKATVATCAYLVGLAQMDFDISVNYAKERIQFGRPIGSFQAIQHKCADMIIDVDGSRFITYKAAWALEENEPDGEMLASMAKAWCSEATRRVVAQGQQIHGGIGFTKDYKVQLYFRRQKWMELMWGDADYHRELVAQKLEI